MDELVEQLKRQIIAALNLEELTPDRIEADSPLFGNGLGLDSIDALELVTMLEEHYGIRITDLEAARRAFTSVNNLARFIRDHQDKCP